MEEKYGMIFSLDNLDLINNQKTGNKAKNLKILLNNGFKVAPGIVIDTDEFDNFQKTLKVNINTINEEYLKIFTKNEKVIVRSSANFEDNKDASFAGIYESYLNIEFENLEKTIILIYKSVYSDKALTYYKNNNIDKDNVKMAIIIQKQIDSIYSGVCFTRNPINNNEEVIIEYVEGSNQNFISGQASPKNIFIKDFKNIDSNDYFSKLIQPKLEQFKLIEKLFNFPQDIEWAIDKKEDLIILQSRNIVFENLNKGLKDLKFTEDKILAQGIGISSGTISGRINVIDTNLKFQDLEKSVNKGDIVVTHNLRVDQIMAIKNASGIIISESSILSHVAIQAREFKIPCVGGIHNIDIFKNNQVVSIDGILGIVLNGEIEINEIEGNFDNLNYQNFPSYFNVDLVKEYKTSDFTFLYSILGNSAMIYLPDMDDVQKEIAAKEIIKAEFGIQEKNIFNNKIKIQINSRKPYIYSYYEDYKKILENKELGEIFKEACIYLNNLDLKNFKYLTEKTRDLTHKEFLKGYNLFKEFKETKNVETLSVLAENLNNSLTYAILYNNVIILSFGNYYLEKLLQKYGGPTLIDLLSKDYFEDKNIQEIKDLAKLLEYYKNTELEPLTENGESFIDIIDYIYENGFSKTVEKYQW